jgi:hypothetical protein
MSFSTLQGGGERETVQSSRNADWAGYYPIWGSEADINLRAPKVMEYLLFALCGHPAKSASTQSSHLALLRLTHASIQTGPFILDTRIDWISAVVI